MVTIAHLAEQIIRKRPFIQEALSRGIINYGALAEEMLPEIKAQLGKNVKHAAVMMAIRRYCDRIEKAPISNIRIERKAEVHVQPNFMEISVENNQRNLEKARNFQLEVGKGEKFYLSISTSEITIIASRRHETILEETFGKQGIMKGLAALVIYFDKSFMKVPGFYYLILRELAWEQINVYELVSTTTELTIVINEKEVGRAFDILNELFGK